MVEAMIRIVRMTNIVMWPQSFKANFFSALSLAPGFQWHRVNTHKTEIGSALTSLSNRRILFAVGFLMFGHVSKIVAESRSSVHTPLRHAVGQILQLLEGGKRCTNYGISAAFGLLGSCYWAIHSMLLQRKICLTAPFE
jgi:hypothetical protein